MESVLVLVIILALVGAVLLRVLGRAERAATGLPIDARVVYSDTGAWRRVDKALFSQRYRLAGKPDYVVADKTGAMIPIEVKPNRTDAQARDSDVMQLMAYGILVEETYNARPEYGLLKYREHVFQIEFTEELRGEFFAILEEMRAARLAENVHRSHDDPTRCRYCGYREECEEKLA